MNAGPIKILLVDDIPENLVALEALVRRDEVQTFRAASGAEALELVLAHEFGVALIDVQMPGMGGFELAELMRGAARSSHIPIIFVTAGSWESRQAFKGYEAGAVDFLFKPIDPHMLRCKVDVFVQLERQRQQLAQQLAQLKESEAALERAVRMREEILGVVSHDLRTPLSIVSMSAELMHRRLTGEALAPVELQLEAITRAAVRMERMIGDLLDMASIRAGRLAVSPQPQPMGSLLVEALAGHEALAAERHIALACEPIAHEVQVSCDRERVLQVLSNLLSNAVKFCPAGSAVRVHARPADDHVRVGVADAGPGIAPEDQRRLFEPYWSGKSHQQGGVGLGLFISKGIVEAHGGRIWVESAAGAGASFYFTLPRCSPAR